MENILSLYIEARVELAALVELLEKAETEEDFGTINLAIADIELAVENISNAAHKMSRMVSGELYTKYRDIVVLNKWHEYTFTMGPRGRWPLVKHP